MATLPPDFVNSVLQTPFAQRQVSTLRDAERAHNGSAQRRQIAALTEKDSTVETTDNDTQVHTDSEGQGSQGRPFTESEENPPASPAPAGPDEEHLIDFEA